MTSDAGLVAAAERIGAMIDESRSLKNRTLQYGFVGVAEAIEVRIKALQDVLIAVTTCAPPSPTSNSGEEG